MSLETPRRIGPYRVLGPLGRGGMGIVLRARHRETAEVVALKTVRVVTPRLLDGMRREIAALARLAHPGIVRIVDRGLQEGVPWYAMELVDGISLRRWAEGVMGPSQASSADTVAVARTSDEAWWTHTLAPPDAPLPPLPEAVAPVTDLSPLLKMFRDICAPLAYMHGEGIVHRDLKPDNVLVTGDDRPVIVDFGLFQYGPRRGGRELLEAPTGAQGTHWYMSPEQARGDPLDPRADLYSLGCMLYELLTGRPPFTGASPLEVLQLHRSAEPDPPSAHADGIPAALDALVLELLAKDPRRRVGFATDVAVRLGRLAGDDRPQPGPTPRSYIYRPMLHGRADALAHIEERLPKAPPGGLILVGGESGVGRTRFAAEAARLALHRSLRYALAGAGSRSASSKGGSASLTPFRPLLQLVADTCREGGKRVTDEILGRRGRLLARYAPELEGLPGQERFPDPDPLPPRDDLFRTFAALTRTLALWTQGDPFVLILDDLHLADEVSLHYLRQLSSVWLSRLPWLVVATYATDADTDRMERALEGRYVEQLLLRRLTAIEVEEMVGEMLALAPPPRGLASYLHRQGQGIPLFVAEQLATLIADSTLKRAPDGQWLAAGHDLDEEMVPETVRSLMERRLEVLDASVRRLVEAAAVAGDESDLELLGGIGGLDEEELLEASHAALALHALETDGQTYRVAHRKLSQIAYERIDPNLRRTMHHRAAEAFGEQVGREAVTAHHYEEAGEPKRAAPAYLAAARQALSRHATSRAEELFRSYLRTAPSSDPDRIEARCELGQNVLSVAGRPEKALVELEIALDEALESGRQDEEIHARWCLAQNLISLGRHDDAAVQLARAESLATELGDTRQRGRCRALGADLHYTLGSYNAAIAAWREALELARESRDRVLEGQALLGLASVLQTRGSDTEALELHRQALAVHRETENRQDEALALLNIGGIELSRGNLDDAVRLFDEGLGMMRDIGARLLEGYTMANRSHLHLLLGRPDLALQDLEAAVAICTEIGQVRLHAMVLCDLALLHLELGREAPARAALQGARVLQARIPDLYLRFRLHWVEGRIALHADTLDLAHRHLLAATGLARQLGDLGMVSEVLAHRAHLALRRGSAHEARPRIREALECATGQHDRWFLANANLLAAEIARRADSDWDEAARRLDLAADPLALHGAPASRVLYLVERAYVLHARSQRTDEVIGRARNLVREFGLGPNSEAARALAELEDHLSSSG